MTTRIKGVSAGWAASYPSWLGTDTELRDGQRGEWERDVHVLVELVCPSGNAVGAKIGSYAQADHPEVT